MAKYLSFIMSPNTMSIGEPEGSLDTPLRNTTPLKRPRIQTDQAATTTRAKKIQKMNQCQLAFHVILMRDVMVDKIDASCKSIDSELNNMVKELDDGKASIQETKETDDELLQLVQQLEESSQAANYSKDCLSTQVTELATISRGRQTKSANTVMPDYDERLDDEIVGACTKALGERDNAIRSALKNADEVKRQVDKFKDELGHVRVEVSERVNAIHLEYEARLNQQRKELRIELNEAEDCLDHMKMMMFVKEGLVEQLTKQLGDLESSNKSLVDAKSEADITMSQLQTENSGLRRDLDTKNQELKAQATLTSQSNHMTRNLELERRLSTLDSDLRERNDELHLQKSLVGSKDEEIRRLEAINAGFLKAQEEAHFDKLSLQADLESANKRLQALEAKYGSQGRSPMIPHEESSPLAGSSTSGVESSIDTTTSRPLGMTNATITPSESVAFTVSLHDATHVNFSSDVLPIDVLNTLRNKFQIWNAEQRAVRWARVQSSNERRSCIAARLDRKKSQWNDGHGYACAVCVHRMRLCIVVDSAERALLLPRKAAEDEGREPKDTEYWTR